jgi:hypothetical protein
MKQRSGFSIQVIVVAILSIAFGSFFVREGLLDTAGSQGAQWVKIMAALLSFSGVFLFLERETRRVQRRFNESVVTREHKLGRPLSPEERAEIKDAIRAAVPDASDSPGFGHPLIRLVARILIVTVPTVALMGVMAAVGACAVGFGSAILSTELTRRSLNRL